jgi:MFS transporter, SP family, galactose:H+ symporter
MIADSNSIGDREDGINHLENKEKKRFLFFVASIAALGGVLFGYDTGAIGAALIFINKTFHPTVFEQELIVSMLVAGACIGAVFSGKICNRFGRRKVLIITSIVFIVGTLQCCFALNITGLIIGRFILGLAVGIASYATPLFIAEISLPETRGLMVLLNSLCITGAQAAAYIIDLIISKHFSEEVSWRIMIAAALIPSVLLLVGMLFAPQSPRWLIMKGKKDKARKILAKIRDLAKIEKEIDEIEKGFSVKQAGWSVLFSKPVLPVLVLGLVYGVLQQFSGINTVMYYGPEIFKTIGFKGSDAQLIATFSMGSLNFIFTIFAMITVDRFGRKALMIIGLAVMMGSLAALSVVLQAGATNFPGGQIIGIIAMMTYISGYAYSLGCLFWLIISEVYPLHIRSLGMGFVAGIQWFANFVVTGTFLTVLGIFGAPWTFFTYAVIALFGLLYTVFYMPETKGVSLEHIEANLRDGERLRDIGLKYILVDPQNLKKSEK